MKEFAMRKRLYFMLPDVEHCKRLVAELREIGFTGRDIQVVAHNDIPLEDLHKASVLQTTELTYGLKLGVSMGGIVGGVGGILMVIFPPMGLVLNSNTVIFTTTLVGIIFGSIISALVARHIPSHQLDTCRHGINLGQILLILDVSPDKVSDTTRFIKTKLRKISRTLSLRDPLTGLYNRPYLEETLQREFYRADRNQQNIGIIMVDIDHFKQFNEQFGYDACDAVLQTLGDFFNKYIRKGDIACRYSDKKFVFVLPGASLEVVQKRAENIRLDVKSLVTEHGNQKISMSIALSIGVAVFPQHGKQFQEVLYAANSAIYHAKMQGGDKAIVAE
jgi:diguanylate cyclase (GGDEF)-like protein